MVQDATARPGLYTRPFLVMGGWVLGVTHLRFRMGMGTWVFTHLPAPRFGFRVWVLGISQHSDFDHNTPNWPFFERYDTDFLRILLRYVLLRGYDHVRTPTHPTQASFGYRVVGTHRHPANGWVFYLPIHPTKHGTHPPFG